MIVGLTIATTYYNQTRGLTKLKLTSTGSASRQFEYTVRF